MVYSDVEKQGYFKTVEQKNKYSITDVKKLVQNNKNVTMQQAIFIIKCVAAFYNAELSKTIYEYNSIKNELKRIVA